METMKGEEFGEKGSQVVINIVVNRRGKGCRRFRKGRISCYKIRRIASEHEEGTGNREGVGDGVL